ncbi:unnamed protein product [Prorocentrum cordatum]|uniref:Mediator of RNA polymerase II transcription subunit 11 n=1 Tax=Prorocentrum cordatum TaxID=2364126 RepID=A0ABN9QE02_9DINO|nr:unnamed protein product [Polarella glacialis]
MQAPAAPEGSAAGAAPAADAGAALPVPRDAAQQQPAAPPPGLLKARLRERTDAALRAVAEAYAVAVEAARVGSPGEAAAGGCALAVHRATMARAADDLLRIAGEVGCVGAAARAPAAAAEAEGQRLLHLQEERAALAHLRERGAGGPLWPALPAAAAARAGAEAAKRPRRAPGEPPGRLLPAWAGAEMFQQGSLGVRGDRPP